MGARHGLPLPRYSCCIRPEDPDKCRENHHTRIVTKRRSHRHKSRSSVQSKRSLSPDFEAELSTYGLLDINTTTAEELMTLPGINRLTATNIVAYRRQIGAFRKIEDLALVPGVGATRFGHVRAEICVRNHGEDNHDGSSTSSGIDVSVNPADNLSADFTNTGESAANGATVIGTRYPSLDEISDRISGTGNSIIDESFDDVTSGLLCQSIRRVTSTPEVGSGVYREHREETHCSEPRVAIWISAPCTTSANNEDAGFEKIDSRINLDTSVCVVAVYGITDYSVLQKLCGELNKLKPNEQATQNSSWNYASPKSHASLDDVTSERCFTGGVLYDGTRVELTDSRPNGDMFACTFQMVDGEKFVVILAKPGKTLVSDELRHTTIDTLKEMTDQGRKSCIMLVGDFGDLSEIPGLPWLHKPTCSPATLNHDLFCANRYTWISHLAVFQSSAPICSVTSEEVQDDQTSPMLPVPDAGSCDGQARTRCPVWMEFAWNAVSDAALQQSQKELQAHANT